VLNNACVCANGTPVSSRQCAVNGANVCISCNAGYTLNKDTSDCFITRTNEESTSESSSSSVAVTASNLLYAIIATLTLFYLN